MKRKSFAIASAAFLLATASFAGLRFEEPQARGYERNHGRKDFMMGICVGQTLAKQGMSVPMPQPGLPVTLDDSTQAAIATAVQNCRLGIKPPQPGASPTAAPTG